MLLPALTFAQADDPSGWIAIGIQLAAGFLMLTKGADWLVGGSSRIARRLGVSVFVIGLTIVAWGTSAPEVVVSAVAAHKGNSAISLGNVLGSNIANLGLVLGASALVLPRVLDTSFRTRDLVTFFGSIGILWVFCLDGALTRVESGVMLGLYGAYTLSLLLFRDKEAALDVPETDSKWPAWLEAAIGFAVVLVGAQLTVGGATAGAERLQIDERVVGLTVVAIGTSLPELAASLGSACKGQSELSLGNVIGSNVFNLIAVLGIVGLVRPLEASAMPDAAASQELSDAFAGVLGLDFYVVAGFSVGSVLLIWLGGSKAGRLKGLLLLGAYFAYNAALF